MAYSPRTRLVYIPVLEMPMKFSLPNAAFQLLRCTTNTAASASPPKVKDDAPLMHDLPAFMQRDVLKAWDLVAQKLVAE